MAFSTRGCRSRVGQERVERLGLDVEPDDQAIGETRLLDFEVLRQEIELRLQRAFVAAQILQRHPQQIAEAHQRPIGRVDVSVHQRGNRVERVEQEMRLKLMLQGAIRASISFVSSWDVRSARSRDSR